MREHFCKKKDGMGFTLIEMLMYIGILVVLVGFIIGFFLGITRRYAESRAHRALEDNLTSAAEILAREIRSARSIYVPTTCFSPLQSGADASCDPQLGQISIETGRNLPTYGSEAESSEDRTYVDFYVDNGTLLRKREGDAVPLSLTSEEAEVTRLEFRDRSTAGVQAVSIDIEMRRAGGTFASSIQTHAVLREYSP